MFAGFETECLAGYEQRYREVVIYPAAARRAQQEAELRLLRQSRGGAPGSARRRLGALLMRFVGQPGAVPVSPTAPRA